MKSPFALRVARTGKQVIEISVVGLTQRQWRSLSNRLEGAPWVHHVSDITGLFYVTSRRAAEMLAKKFGPATEVNFGKIDTSGISYWFEKR